MKTSRAVLRRHDQYVRMLERHRAREAQAREALAVALQAERARGTSYGAIASDLGLTRQRVHQMANGE